MKIDTLQFKSLFQNVQLTEFQEYKNKMLHFLHWQKLVETSFGYCWKLTVGSYKNLTLYKSTVFMFLVWKANIASTFKMTE